jgi:hypothetical protein
MRRLVLLNSTFLLIALAVLAPAGGQSQEVTINPDYAQLQPKGLGILSTGPTTPPPTAMDSRVETRRQNLDALTHLRQDGARRNAATTLAFPTVANNPLASSNPNFFGLTG